MTDDKPRGFNNGTPTRRVLACLVGTVHPYRLEGPTSYGWSLNLHNVSLVRGQADTPEGAWEALAGALERLQVVN
jgi:hypothetical protein